MSPENATMIRLACFVGVLLVMTVWELLAPRRKLTVRRTPRWASNLTLVAINTVALRFLLPITFVATAGVARERGWGVLNLVTWPAWVEVTLGVVVLDLIIYLQHVMFHAVPLFWRLHKVHHADLDFDVTTGIRFHTLEILLSGVIKLAAVLVLGPSMLAVVIFEIALNATSMFNHSNARLPLGIDRWLRLLVVTPDMHRVHHSVIRRETNSNFGFNLPWWDRLLGTYRDQPEAGHEEMTIGLTPLRDEHQVDRLPGMLLLPLHSEESEQESSPEGTLESGVPLTRPEGR